MSLRMSLLLILAFAAGTARADCEGNACATPARPAGEQRLRRRLARAVRGEGRRNGPALHPQHLAREHRRPAADGGARNDRDRAQRRQGLLSEYLGYAAVATQFNVGGTGGRAANASISFRL